MIPRAVLDIGGSTLLESLFRFGAPPSGRESQSQTISRLWDSEHPSLAFLSVRSGLDAVLSAVNWPAGSEVLLSAVTIPQIIQIIQEHGFVPVPVDVDPETLAPVCSQLRSRITPNTRAILTAHLFGSRLDLSQIAQIAREHESKLWEDVAQGYAADGHAGDPGADLSFFSFGLIKSQTVLGGAVVRFRDEELASRCNAIQTAWPGQSSHAYRKRVGRAIGLKVLGNETIFTFASKAAKIAKIDLDEWISRSVRGFDASKLFAQLRQQPCWELLALLEHRLTQPDRGWLARRSVLAQQYRRLLPPHVLLGALAKFPSLWVLPIRSCDPQALRSALASQGYDASVRGSHLCVVPAHSKWAAPMASEWLPELLYLPLHPSLRDSDLQVITSTVYEYEQAKN
jgi:perosamine synthetase